LILSIDKQNYLLHLIVRSLEENQFLEYKDSKRVHLRTQNILSQCVKISEEIDQKIVQKIRSLKRNVIEQSSEWNILYSNYLEEEMVRRGLTPTQER